MERKAQSCVKSHALFTKGVLWLCTASLPGQSSTGDIHQTDGGCNGHQTSSRSNTSQDADPNLSFYLINTAKINTSCIYKKGRECLITGSGRVTVINKTSLSFLVSDISCSHVK
ncbi:hypothetical protein Q7C36_017954 [Tachysurus vachellii]|uniref:Uncharacterized protein n=1 Tax=Tachysurus vachellii TaxID=175792 RepID=A0AA88M1B7_TACVA|nr:hypothetical protein Q7C36_017954 [Tachysurus vachellii]